MTTERLLTVKQIAEQLQVKPVTVQRWLRAGRIRGTLLADRIGWRVPESEFLRFYQREFGQGMATDTSAEVVSSEGTMTGTESTR